MVLFLPIRPKFITSIFKGHDIIESSSEKKRLWVEILNKSFEEELKIDRGSPPGFVAIGPEHLKFNHETQITTTKKERKRTPCHRIHSGSSEKQKKELSGSLNRYGFAYARRYKVNQAAKVVPGVIKAPANDINNIAEKRSNQIISEVGKVIDCVLPEIVRGTTEGVYQTPFRLLGEFFYLSFMT